MLKTGKFSLILAISMILALALAISGCGVKNNANNGQPQATPQATANDAAQSATPQASGNADAGTADLLDQVKKSGELKVGLMGTYAPYNFLNDKKEIDGFDADIAKEVAKRLGVAVKFFPQDFSGLIPSLQAGKIDAIISQVTITEDRKKQIDFSDPYITNQVKIIVRDDNTSIAKLEDFKGKNIGIGLGTNDEAYLRNEVLPKVGKFNIKTYNDVITSLQDLNAGRIDATINNLYALKPIVDKNGFKIKAVGDAIKSDQAGIAIRKGNPQFLAAVNKALADMKAEGTYASIFKKWFGEEPSAQ